MKLKVNEVYKYNEEQDVLEQEEFSYWVCIGEKEDYFILHELESYCKNNNMDYNAFYDSLEETSSPDEYNTLQKKYFKRCNSLEAIYHKTQAQQEDNLTTKKNGFQVV